MKPASIPKPPPMRPNEVTTSISTPPKIPAKDSNLAPKIPAKNSNFPPKIPAKASPRRFTGGKELPQPKTSPRRFTGGMDPPKVAAVKPRGGSPFSVQSELASKLQKFGKTPKMDEKPPAVQPKPPAFRNFQKPKNSPSPPPVAKPKPVTGIAAKFEAKIQQKSPFRPPLATKPLPNNGGHKPSLGSKPKPPRPTKGPSLKNRTPATSYTQVEKNSPKPQVVPKPLNMQKFESKFQMRENPSVLKRESPDGEIQPSKFDEAEPLKFVVIQGYQAQTSSECTIVEGDIITVDDVTSNSDWCYVTSSKNNNEGWAPKEYLKPYVEKPESPIEEDIYDDVTSEETMTCLYDVTDASFEGSLKLRRGDKVVVVERTNQDWWFCRMVGGGSNEGWVPPNYLG